MRRCWSKEKLELHCRNDWARARTRAQLDWDFSYLENMASIGVPAADLASTVDRVCEIAECDSTIVLEKRLVAVYTFEQMLRVHKASGCEVLVVDAEGHDCSILRSMIAACRWGGVPWPYAIRFETRGHADSREGAGAEDGMVRRLQWHSYLLLAVNGDTTLVHSAETLAPARVGRQALHAHMLSLPASAAAVGARLWPRRRLRFLSMAGHGRGPRAGQGTIPILVLQELLSQKLKLS